MTDLLPTPHVKVKVNAKRLLKLYYVKRFLTHEERVEIQIYQREVQQAIENLRHVDSVCEIIKRKGET